MKLTEMVINKKLQATCKKVLSRLKEEGYRTAEVTPVSNTEVRVFVPFDTFLSSQQQPEFDRDVRDITNIAEAKLDPTRVIDNSSFGGHSTFLIKRGKKIDADALLSEVDVTFRFPTNRYT